MNTRFSPFLSAIALAALAFLLTPSFSQASVTTLTGGDPADASDGIGYAPTGTLIEAYRMTADPNSAQAGMDTNAYTYKGITFQPFLLLGGPGAPDANVTTQGTSPLTATITNGFFYGAGATDNIGSGGVHTADDTALFNVAQYQSYATNGNRRDTSGTETLTLSGLVSGNTYQIDLFVGDSYNDNDLPYLYTMTGAGGALPTDTVPAPRPHGIVYDVRESVIADISGNITVTATSPGSGDNAAIYAFSVELPEPASMSLLACGSLLMLRRRRCQL